MRYWSRETVRSAFYDDLERYVRSEMDHLFPRPNHEPLPDYPLTVDWGLTHSGRDLYVFGVRGNDKAKHVAICLLEFQQAQLPFISIVVHEDMADLGRKESFYLTKNADKQYPVPNDFYERASEDITRLVGAYDT